MGNGRQSSHCGKHIDKLKRFFSGENLQQQQQKKNGSYPDTLTEIILKFWKLSHEVIKLETRQMHQIKGFKIFCLAICNTN